MTLRNKSNPTSLRLVFVSTSSTISETLNAVRTAMFFFPLLRFVLRHLPSAKPLISSLMRDFFRRYIHDDIVAPRESRLLRKLIFKIINARRDRES